LFGRALPLILAAAIALVAITRSAAAQDVPGPVDHQHDIAAAAGSDGWTWASAARTFFGFNGQDRRFRNFSAWEAQNWAMGSGTRSLGAGALDLVGMISLEPFTLHKIGSPQVFQTGETYRGAPLIDYQHPHDLVMGAGGTYRRPVAAFTVTAGADLVGSPTLGPTAYMHRASAAHNPQAPLSHHYLDSTHITPGVVRAGIGTRGLTLEASTFHGREPDEERTDVDLGKLDSFAVRAGWTNGRWRAQASAAQLTLPEAVTPYDARRLTASVEYTGGAAARIRGLTAAFGQNREIHGNFEAYLFEAEVAAWGADVFYSRVESVAKDILDVGFHPRGFFHRHRQSQVDAFTLGYVHSLVRRDAGDFSVGGDVTGYAVPSNLQEAYGRPWSFHAFVRFAFDSSATAPHIH
jgi:hypothetical protein